MFTKEELENLVNKYKNIWKIARIKKCCPNTVKNYLKRFNIKQPEGFYKTGKKIGRKKGTKCPEHVKQELSAKFKGEGNPFYGKKHSDITKKKMSLNHSDFTKEKNPFKKACKKDPSILKKLSDKQSQRWSEISILERYKRNKKTICGDLSVGQWHQIFNNAKQRKIPLEITPQDIWNLYEQQNGKCSLSGVDINLKTIYEITASLDRIDSSKGYTRDNVQWLHKTINIMKNSLNQADFISICEKVCLYNVKKSI